MSHDLGQAAECRVGDQIGIVGQLQWDDEQLAALFLQSCEHGVAAVCELDVIRLDSSTGGMDRQVDERWACSVLH